MYKNGVAMQLWRNLFFFVAKFNMTEHLPEVLNGAADALSRNKRSLSLSQVQSAQLLPTPIPRKLLQLLVVKMPDWTSIMQSCGEIFQDWSSCLYLKVLFISSKSVCILEWSV